MVGSYYGTGWTHMNTTSGCDWWWPSSAISDTAFTWNETIDYTYPQTTWVFQSAQEEPEYDDTMIDEMLSEYRVV